MFCPPDFPGFDPDSPLLRYSALQGHVVTTTTAPPIMKSLPVRHGQPHLVTSSVYRYSMHLDLPPRLWDRLLTEADASSAYVGSCIASRVLQTFPDLLSVR